MSKYLVVVDMQKDFIDGALGTAEAQAIVPKVIEKVTSFKGPVMFTRDTHEENYLETQEGQNLPVKHCIRGTDGWELQPDLNDYALKNHCLIFDKPTFGSTSQNERSSTYESCCPPTKNHQSPCHRTS